MTGHPQITRFCAPAPVVALFEMNLINLILGENDDFLQGREALRAPFDKQKDIIHVVPDKFRTDVKALSDYIGEANFRSGLRIEVSLSEILSVVPRKRRRVDAYNSLVKYLKDEQNITLTIKARK